MGALVVGGIIGFTVWQQPRTPMPQGADLIVNLLWLGLVYGLVDVLLLSVMPIVAVWQACKLLGWTEGSMRRLAVGVLALLASLLVTATYHLGYPEFQSAAVLIACGWCRVDESGLSAHPQPNRAGLESHHHACGGGAVWVVHGGAIAAALLF